MKLKKYMTSSYIKIIEILKKYDLLKEIKDVDEFINGLNVTERSNLLKLNLPVDFGKKYNKLLIDKIFLNSKEYINDLSFIKFSPTKEQRNALIKVAKNPVSINHRYHRSDMYYIFRTCNKNIYKYLVKASTNITSLENKKHLYHMSIMSFSNEVFAEAICEKLCCGFDNIKNKEEELKLIETAKTTEIARSLGMCSTDYFSINSKYHDDDMKLIYNAKNDLIAKYLGVIATNPLSLNSKSHKLHMTEISNAKDDITASILFHMIVDEEMQNTEFHEIEIFYISNAKNEFQLRCLCNLIFDPVSRKNPLYLSNLDIISSCVDEYQLKHISKSILDNNNKIHTYKDESYTIDATYATQNHYLKKKSDI